MMKSTRWAVHFQLPLRAVVLRVPGGYPEKVALHRNQVALAEVFFGRHEEVLTQREIIKHQTLLEQRSLNLHSELQVVQ